MLVRPQNRIQIRRVNWWSWARREFGARERAGVSHGHCPCVLEETTRHCKSGDSSARARADVDAYAGAVQGCGAGAVVGERARRSRNRRLWGGRAGRIVLGGLVEARKELTSRLRSVLARMTVEDR
jgi:hypothetical protein